MDKLFDLEKSLIRFFIQPPRIIQPDAKNKLRVRRIISSSPILGSRTFNKQSQPDSISLPQTEYYILVDISGRLKYNQSANIQKGIPGIRLRLDWDSDNNPTTSWTPYPNENIQHADYDDTDADGNYYFYFLLISNVPATDIAPQIRVWGLNNNVAAFDGDMGNGEYLMPWTGTNIIAITDPTSVIGTVNPQIDSYQGGSLRNIYRARQFSINNLGFNPHTIRYYIRRGANSSHFCSSGSCGDGINVNVPYILFNQIPRSHVGYHEYGHFVEYRAITSCNGY
jgi:hypothetical protein